MLICFDLGFMDWFWQLYMAVLLSIVNGNDFLYLYSIHLICFRYHNLCFAKSLNTIIFRFISRCPYTFYLQIRIPAKLAHVQSSSRIQRLIFSSWGSPCVVCIYVWPLTTFLLCNFNPIVDSIPQILLEYSVQHWPNLLKLDFFYSFWQLCLQQTLYQA